MLLAMDDASELEVMQEAERLTMDPAISVGDLEGALNAYMGAVGYRNLQEVVDIIHASKATWKTSPKAEGLET
jgi:hypothetical protein